MLKFIPALAAAALAAFAPAEAAPRIQPEAQLARALEGRVAGNPVDCINLRNVRSSRMIDKTAILFDAGGTIYVNRPTAGRESLDRDDALVTRTHSSQLCSIDTVTIIDTAAHFQRGIVFLGDFVPYKRVRVSSR
jgi:hypothetical protein